MKAVQNNQNGKGDKARHVLNEHWRNEYDRIFKKKLTSEQKEDNRSKSTNE